MKGSMHGDGCGDLRWMQRQLQIDQIWEKKKMCFRSHYHTTRAWEGKVNQTRDGLGSIALWCINISRKYHPHHNPLYSSVGRYSAIFRYLTNVIIVNDSKAREKKKKKPQQVLWMFQIQLFFFSSDCLLPPLLVLPRICIYHHECKTHVCSLLTSFHYGFYVPYQTYSNSSQWQNVKDSGVSQRLYLCM